MFKDTDYFADYKCCCGKCQPLSTLTCNNNQWMEITVDTACFLGGPNSTCGDGAFCPMTKPEANSACPANQTKPETCEYGQYEFLHVVL